MSIASAINNFFHPQGLTPDNAKALTDALEQQRDVNKDLSAAGFDFLNALLTGGGGIDLPGLVETFQSLQDLMDELEGEEVDPEEWKSKVIKASDVFEAMNEFRTKKLFQFYRDKLQDIRSDVETSFSSANFTPIINNLKKGDLTGSLSSMLNAINAIIQTAIDVAELFHVLDDSIKAMEDKVLGQQNPEVKVDGPHRTRKAA